MAGGRPTTYTPEVLEKANTYLEEWEAEGDMIPSIVGLAKYIERARSLLYVWAEDKNKKEFKDILEEINEQQHQVLINKGLNSEFNSNITKLVLGKHRYHDKQEVDNKTSLTVVMPDDDAETL